MYFKIKKVKMIILRIKNRFTPVVHPEFNLNFNQRKAMQK